MVLLYRGGVYRGEDNTTEADVEEVNGLRLKRTLEQIYEQLLYVPL